MEHFFFKRCAMGAGLLSCLLAGNVSADEPQRRVEINEYVVRGNTVLDAQAIEAAGVDGSLRPEQLDLAAFVRLADQLALQTKPE